MKNYYTIKKRACPILLLFILFFLLFIGANAQTSLVKWSITGLVAPPITPTTNLGINSGKLITAVGQGSAPYVGTSGVANDPVLYCNNWTNPANTSWWLINFSTTGYTSITFSYILDGLQFGPHAFQAQYSTSNASGPYTNFGSAINFTTPYAQQTFPNVSLPPACDNQANVWVRIISTATLTSSQTAGGCYIDEVEVIASGSLPVKLLSFNGAFHNDKVDLNWQTAGELNNDHFEIERCNNSAMCDVPGAMWETIGTVKGNGSTNAIQKYQFIDDLSKTDASMTNPLFYRLKQVDFDGTENTYQTISVSLDEEKQVEMNIMPNPFNTDFKLNISSTKEANAEIMITDINGKKIAVLRRNLQKGNNSISVNDLKDARSGLYFVQIKDNGQTQIIKINKL